MKTYRVEIIPLNADGKPTDSIKQYYDTAIDNYAVIKNARFSYTLPFRIKSDVDGDRVIDQIEPI